MRRNVGITWVVFLLAVATVGTFIYLDRAKGNPNAQNAIDALNQPVRQVSTLTAGPNFVAAVKTLSPAVVAIDVAGVREDWNFTQPFQGQGSGVIISADGYVVTNGHVVEGATKIGVRLINGAKYDGIVVGVDPRHDIAVVKVNAKNLPAAEMGDSDALQVGEWVMAIGNPLGYQNSLTVGVVSAKNRQIGSQNGGGLTELIQTDAAINAGNSGGALANIAGQVVGINTVIATTTGGSIGLGFAVPINEVKVIAKALLEHKRLPIPFVGVSIVSEVDLSDPMWRDRVERVAGISNVPDYGVIISRVLPGWPAADSGVQDNDIILSTNGKKLQTAQDFSAEINKAGVGKSLSFEVSRQGETRKLDVIVRDMPDNLRNIYLKR
jgi:serine protease Do